MKNAKQRDRRVRTRGLQKVVAGSSSVECLLERYAGRCRKLGLQLYRKVCDVDDSVNIIARELARQSKRKP